MGKRILFVDDERPILRAIARLFFDSDYEVLTAESGEEGLRVLADGPVDVVVSDIRMPGMDGYQFLRKVKTLYPGTTRLILSGYVEESTILNSIVDGSSNRYLLKPWEGADIRRKIAGIFAARDLFPNMPLLDLANRLENLAVVPGVYEQAIRLMEEGADADRIATEIAVDPAVAAAVLRVANSAFYTAKTGSISRAIASLGSKTTKTILLSCHMFAAAPFHASPFSVRKLSRKASTANRMMTAIFSQLLHKHVPDTYQTAALLTDIGLVMCLYYFPDRYVQILRKFAREGVGKDFVALEREAFGMSHQEFGGYLLNWWGLPYPIVETALYHHEPLRDAVRNKELVAAAHIAGHYAWRAVSPQMAPKLDQGAFKVLGLPEGEVALLMQKIILLAAENPEESLGGAD